MADLPESLQNQIIKIFAARPEVERLILFGSRARNDNEERSDIDLAVAAPAASKREWLDIAALTEEIDTLLPIDLLRLEEVSPSLKLRILTEGRVLYDRSQSGSKHA